MSELRVLKEPGEGQPDLSFASTLLLTKMQPPLTPSVFSRPRLLERLNTPAPLTLVIAPAGYGKTTLLADWAQRRKSVFWLTLDDSDNDVQQLARYLCGGFDVQPYSTTPEDMLASLSNHITAGKQHVTLILDNFHVLNSRRTHQFITHLLDHQPACLRLIIASRTLPPLPLARLRVQGKLHVIRSAELAFTSQEAAAYYQAQYPQIAVEWTQLERMKGWAAGMQILALAYQEAEFQTERAELTRQYAREYLVQEVLQAQPPAIQTFLLQTAFLERLTPDQCNVVTRRSDSQAVLQNLRASDLFLRRHPDHSYTYIPFFRDALREHLMLNYSDEARTVINRIAHYKRGAKVQTHGEGLIAELSEREREVLLLLANGHSSPEIAQQMIIAVSTVKTHLKHIYRKLNVDNRYQALKRAHELNLVQLERESRFQQFMR